MGFAALDLSTGEFRATEFSGEGALRRVQEELEQLRPKELLYGSAAPLFESSGARGENQPSFARPDPSAPLRAGSRGRLSLHNPSPHNPSPRAAGATCTETPLDDWIFAPDHAIPLLENHFGVLSLEGFGLAGRTAAAAAAGAILYYVRSTQRGSLDHVDRIGWYERQNCLVLDAVTVRNLELIEPLFAGADAGVTLLRSIDAAVTPMGKRLLRAWLLRPSLDLDEINARLDAVEAGVKEMVAREELRRALDGVLDLERLLSRVTLETANPRDVLALAASLGRIPAVRIALGRLAAERLKTLHASLDELSDVRGRIETTIVPEPPLSFGDGGVIAAGLDRDLDELRELSRNSKQVLAQIEQRERGRTGISSLKVKFNSIFGYYIEVSKPNLHLVPQDYDRKQTLVGAERFTTPELKEYEVEDSRRAGKDCRDRAAAVYRTAHGDCGRGQDEFGRRRWRWRKWMCWRRWRTSRRCGIIAGRSFVESGEGGELEIVEGRHPVIEQQEMAGGSERFVPNDLYLNGSTHNILLLTGPNMGGKSTYLRQTALIVILAQMGSFVPARVGAAERGGSRVHAHWGERQSGARALDVHGGDDGDGGDSAYGDGAVVNFAR